MLGAGLAVIHTWSPLVRLLRRLASGKQQQQQHSGLRPGGVAPAGGMSGVVPPAGVMLMGQTAASTTSLPGGCDLPSIACGAAAKALEAAADGVEAVAGRQGRSIASVTWLPSPQEIHTSQV